MPTTALSTDDTTLSTLASQSHYLMWFRRDLRLHDNTALAALCERAQANNACSENTQVSAVFFFMPKQWHTHDDSLTQVDHIARTVPELARDLYKQLNITLTVLICPEFSDCIDAIGELGERQQISCVMANHEYEGNEIDRDTQLTKQLSQSNIEFVRWHDQCILPPQTITTNDNNMYQVFTPFYKKWRHTLDVSLVETHKAQAVNTHNIAKTNAKSFNPKSSRPAPILQRV